MKKILSVIALITFVSLPVSATAAILLDENFTGTTIHDNLTISGDPLVNLNKWIDFPNSHRWSINSGDGSSDGAYAQHLTQISDETNLLFYGIETSVVNGTEFSFSFDYITKKRAGRVVVAGLNKGVHVLDPYAPWFGGGDDNDGIILLDQNISAVSSWQKNVHFNFFSTGDFDAIAVGFMMGGTDGMRGVDNIYLESTAPVPEPSTFLLFGAGLAGLAAVARRKK